ncbi:RagB/SusD family nutrient uptake outer membrane protein [Mariniflexile jejuense]|uniref:RagB/SusD family nutrient uptake outer membrane protein n=1 Tax=Mariniflexile jejuense TaxID=1173582 RepID=A0ABW3JL74_9FLAO
MKNSILSLVKPLEIRAFLLVLITGIALFSCEETLEEEPEYAVDAAKIFSTEERAELALKGALFQIENGFWANQGTHQLIAASGTFLYRSTSSGGYIAEYNNNIFKDNQPWSSSIWNDIYSSIYSLNVITNYFETNKPDFDKLSDGYKKVLGSAYFLRAYQYFKLVRFWGKVPMPLQPAIGITHTPLSTEVEVYLQIIKDFEQAKTLLPAGSGVPQNFQGPIKTAADAFLAKVYATQAGWYNMPELWVKAKTHADLVIASNNYMLEDDIAKLHSTAGRNSREAIFELQANYVVNLNNLSQAYNPLDYEYDGSFGGFIKVQPWMWTQQMGDNLYSDYTKNATTGKITAVREHDPRVDITYIDSSFTRVNSTPVTVYPRSKTTSGAYLYVAKYLDFNRTSNASMCNWKVLRYADILLLRAEIENEINGPANAYQYVNQVLDRARRNGKGTYPLSWNLTNVPTKESFRKKIAWERMYELIGEGHEFYESRRRGKDFLVNEFISVHNNFNDPVLAPLIRTKATDDGIMHLVIPLSESANNNAID